MTLFILKTSVEHVPGTSKRMSKKKRKVKKQKLKSPTGCCIYLYIFPVISPISMQFPCNFHEFPLNFVPYKFPVKKPRRCTGLKWDPNGSVVAIAGIQAQGAANDREVHFFGICTKNQP